MEGHKPLSHHDFAARKRAMTQLIIVQEAILQQLANLRSHADSQWRLRGGKLLLHGWLRDDETSAITAYDPVVGQFCD